MRYCPSSLVVAVRVSLVAVLTAVTSAPWTMACCGSRTVPSIEPVGSWAKATRERLRTRSACEEKLSSHLRWPPLTWTFMRRSFLLTISVRLASFCKDLNLVGETSGEGTVSTAGSFHHVETKAEKPRDDFGRLQLPCPQRGPGENPLFIGLGRRRKEATAARLIRKNVFHPETQRPVAPK